MKVTLKNYKDVLFKTGLYKKNKDGTISHAAHKSPVLTEDDSDKAAADQYPGCNGSTSACPRCSRA